MSEHRSGQERPAAESEKASKPQYPWWEKTKRKPGPPRPKVTVASFRDDPMFPAVSRAVAAILARGGNVVAPVDVMVQIGWLSAEDLTNWRTGGIPYLEKVIRCNLTRLSRFLRILGFHCHDLHLVATPAAYTRSGGGRAGPLRFTKTGEEKLEKIYARHFVWPGKRPFHPPRPPAPPAEVLAGPLK